MSHAQAAAMSRLISRNSECWVGRAVPNEPPRTNVTEGRLFACLGFPTTFQLRAFLVEVWGRPVRSRPSAADIIPRLEDGASPGDFQKITLSLPTTTSFASPLPPLHLPRHGVPGSQPAASGQTRGWTALSDLFGLHDNIMKNTRRARLLA